MRTTVTLQLEVAAKLKARMAREGKSLSAVINEALDAGLISIGFPITRMTSTTRSAHLAFDDHSDVKVLLHAYNRVAPNHRSRGWVPECGRDFDPAGRRRRRVRDAGNGASNSGITDYLNLGSAKESPAAGRKR